MGSLITVALWLAGYGFLFSRVQEQRSQSVLYAEFRKELAEATAPLGGVIAAGRPVALLDAGSGGVRRQVVVEGTTSHELTRGPGHLAGTPLPGQAGVSVIFGRSVTYGAPFGHLAALRRGDPITITTGEGTYRYRVDAVRYPGDPLPSALASGKGRLTLVTSIGTRWRAGWAPQHAIYVDASLVGNPSNSPAGANVARSVAEGPLQGDPDGVVLLVVWMSAGLLVAVAGAWGLKHSGTAVTLMLATPLSLVVLWGASDAAAQLLPNLV